VLFFLIYWSVNESLNSKFLQKNQFNNKVFQNVKKPKDSLCSEIIENKIGPNEQTTHKSINMLKGNEHNGHLLTSIAIINEYFFNYLLAVVFLVSNPEDIRNGVAILFWNILNISTAILK
jgi:hypothetical protein